MNQGQLILKTNQNKMELDNYSDFIETFFIEIQKDSISTTLSEGMIDNIKHKTMSCIGPLI